MASTDRVAQWAQEHADTILSAVEADDQRGYCVGCGAEATGVEPDARRYECDVCDQPMVYGAEELMLYLPL